MVTGERLSRFDLNLAMRRFLKRKERYLERQCRKLWRMETEEAKYLMGEFFAGRHDSIVVTLALYLDGIGYVPDSMSLVETP